MSTNDKPKNKRTINQKYKENDSENDKSRRKVTEKQSVRTSACSRASLGLGLMHVCVCVFPGDRTPAQTEWAGSVGWRGAPWIPLQASSLSGPAKVSCLPVGGWGWQWQGAGRGKLHQHGHRGFRTLCLIATAMLAHTSTPRMNFNTNTSRS